MRWVWLHAVRTSWCRHFSSLKKYCARRQPHLMRLHLLQAATRWPFRVSGMARHTRTVASARRRATNRQRNRSALGSRPGVAQPSKLIQWSPTRFAKMMPTRLPTGMRFRRTTADRARRAPPYHTGASAASCSAPRPGRPRRSSAIRFAPRDAPPSIRRRLRAGTDPA